MPNRNVDIRFRGAINLPRAGNVPVATQVEFDPLDPTSLNVELLILSAGTDLFPVHGEILHMRQNELRVENDWDPDSPLIIRDISGINQTQGRISCEVSEISCGLERKAADFEMVHLSTLLTSPGILSKTYWTEHRPDGSVLKKQRRHNDPQWDTQYGTVIAQLVHEHQEAGGQDGLEAHSIKTAQLLLDANLSSFSRFDELMDGYWPYVEDAATILSFCYRTVVRPYHSTIHGKAKSGSPNFINFPSVRKRKFDESFSYTKSEPLIDGKSISALKFGVLADSLRNCREADAIRKAVVYLTASRSAYIETSYFYSFLALDFIVRAAQRMHGLKSAVSSKDWKIIESSLRSSLSSLESGLPAAAKVKAKLPELKRLPFTENLFAVVRRLRIKTSDIWGTKGFEVGIAEATKMRNDLFHAGTVESYHEMINNGVRVRTLVERIILKMLGWPASNTWVRCDEELNRINARAN